MQFFIDVLFLLWCAIAPQVRPLVLRCLGKQRRVGHVRTCTHTHTRFPIAKASATKRIDPPPPSAFPMPKRALRSVSTLHHPPLSQCQSERYEAYRPSTTLRFPIAKASATKRIDPLTMESLQIGVRPSRLQHSLLLHVCKKYIPKLRSYTLPMVS